MGFYGIVQLLFVSRIIRNLVFFLFLSLTCLRSNLSNEVKLERNIYLSRDGERKEGIIIPNMSIRLKREEDTQLFGIIYTSIIFWTRIYTIKGTPLIYKRCTYISDVFSFFFFIFSSFCYSFLALFRASIDNTITHDSPLFFLKCIDVCTHANIYLYLFLETRMMNIGLFE